MVAVPSTATVREAVELLARNNILSAPVRDIAVGDEADWRDTYLGVVDMLDVAAFVLDHLGGVHDGSATLLDTLFTTGAGAARVTEVVGAGGFAPFVALKESISTMLGTSLQAVHCEGDAAIMMPRIFCCVVAVADAILVLGKHHLKRVFVVNDDGHLVGVITQSAMVSVIASVAADIDATQLSLTELGLAHKEDALVTATEDDSVWDVLKVGSFNLIHLFVVVFQTRTPFRRLASSLTSRACVTYCSSFGVTALVPCQF